MTDDIQSFASQAAAVSSADQMSAHCINVAENVAAYHRTLLERGISQKLADNLTLQMADYMWGGDRGCGCEGE